MKSHKLESSPSLACPTCGKVLDGATETSSGPGPGVDDLGICLYCVTVVQYKEGDGGLKLVHCDESVLDTETRLKLETAKRVAREVATKLGDTQ